MDTVEPVSDGMDLIGLKAALMFKGILKMENGVLCVIVKGPFRRAERQTKCELAAHVVDSLLGSVVRSELDGNLAHLVTTRRADEEFPGLPQESDGLVVNPKSAENLTLRP